MQQEKHTYQPIENYGIIGNLKTVALVSLAGSVDFMSFPDFDSPTIFAKLLDAGTGGSFSVAPVMPGGRSKQMYLPDTAVLLTRFFSEEGIAEICDYMPVKGHRAETPCAIVRMVRSVRGTIQYRLSCDPAFDYGRASRTCSREENEIIFRSVNDGNAMVRLIADVPLELEGDCGKAEFTLKESETAFIVLESVEEKDQDDLCKLDYYRKETYHETISFWRQWVAQSTYEGRWNEVVHRSAITLKLLTSSEHGSMVAAPTFSLPETPGGIRNWDYRFTWIRDAAFTMYAFLKLGFNKEATRFLQWIHDRSMEDKLKLMYRIDGSNNLDEKILENLEGYMGAAPVRIGNAAQDQLQLDIYGELIDTVYIYNKQYAPITFEFWQHIVKQVEMVMEHWQRPDHGIWEIRNEEKEFLHTRLMCWVAMDRAIKIGVHRSFPFPVSKWERVRDEIYMDIYENFWNEEVQAWVQHKGSPQVDASVLLMSLMHFISPYEPRWLSTLEAVKKQLSLDVLVYRYRNEAENIDGLEGEEGTFTMCSFWLIEAKAKSGDVIGALDDFEKMLGYANHLGLFAEMISSSARHLGNFPQAFTHLALISAALELDKQLERMGM